MNTKEAAKKWDVSVRTVTNYCINGFVTGAVKEKGIWNIPDDSLCPHISNAKKDTSICDNIMQALDNNMALNAQAFHTDTARLRRLCEDLCKSGLIASCEQELDSNLFVLTVSGREYVKSTAAKRAQILRDIFKMVIPGAAGAIAGALPHLLR